MPVTSLKKSSGVKLAVHNATVWRYMSIPKFLDLIMQQRLRFSPSAQFEDRFEFSLSDSVREWFLADGHSEEELQGFEKSYRLFRESTYVNCWSMSPHENYALWKIYVGGEGVAIKSTVSKVRDAMQGTSRNVYDGKVRYSSYERKLLSLDQMVMTKLPVYRYEEEYRLFFVESTPSFDTSKGLFENLTKLSEVTSYVEVDLEEMIDQIVISPLGAPWLREIVEEVVKTYASKLASKIHYSTISPWRG